ncbi:Protein CBG27734 [Caenorhabditis briggsae]|uniref:Uncharacterized protein n=2 Tax=Caenorhabditis briggsae TaxID=6238 RepID=A0AAE8ZT49_CAEBR|nr:Protein CBG27734 [Caenorhabditis briggsae]ULT82415.1 hypothetical protein L3Y34_011995 [Caenorhabditis briggsae]UMM41714.1 hypothetical protein L5515_017854 [Caenorhabditis briggsae]CAS00012.1 Protein CBG27734 [Caenorhabditis briggsae]
MKQYNYMYEAAPQDWRYPAMANQTAPGTAESKQRDNNPMSDFNLGKRSVYSVFKLFEKNNGFVLVFD